MAEDCRPEFRPFSQHMDALVLLLLSVSPPNSRFPLGVSSTFLVPSQMFSAEGAMECKVREGRLKHERSVGGIRLHATLIHGCGQTRCLPPSRCKKELSPGALLWYKKEFPSDSRRDIFIVQVGALHLSLEEGRYLLIRKAPDGISDSSPPPAELHPPTITICLKPLYLNTSVIHPRYRTEHMLRSKT